MAGVSPLLRALAIALVVVAGLVAFSPLSLVRLSTAQTNSATQATSQQQEAAEVLLNLTGRAIAVAKSMGLNVTQAEQMYSQALDYFKEGQYGQCMSVAVGIMRLLATQFEQQRPTPVPQALGVEAQLKAIEAFVSSTATLNATEKEKVLTVVEEGLANLSKGNVTAAVKALAEAKGQLSNYSVSVSEYARHAMIGRIAKAIAHAKHRAEQAWSFLSQVNASASEQADEIFGVIEEALNASARNMTPAQLVEAAKMAEELQNEAAEVEPFPNATGRVMAFVAQAHVIRGINESVEAILGTLQYLTGSENQTAQEAIRLLVKALNDTYTAAILFAKGNDTGSLEVLNQSISLANESLSLAENLSSSSHGSARAVGRTIAKADNLTIRLDERLYELISSQSIIGKVLEFDALLLYRLNETTYIGIAKIVNNSGQHLHAIFIMVSITASTKVVGNLTSAQLPVETTVIGLVKGRAEGLYIIVAENVTVTGSH
ncbi:MAG: hypothetical protein ACP5HK_00720 [Acidilobus sp.]